MKMKKREFYWLIITVTVIVYACSSTRPKENLQSIIPPLDSNAPSATLFEIDNSKDTLLELENGTSIQIPENCFVLQDGSVATENVTIEFAQLNNPASIIASGIPMTYADSAGKSVQMESAGMFEIRGFVNTEELEIREGKSIQVNLSSKVEGDYDFFHFEENELGNKGEWKVLERNTLSSGAENKNGKSEGCADRPENARRLFGLSHTQGQDNGRPPDGLGQEHHSEAALERNETQRAVPRKGGHHGGRGQGYSKGNREENKGHGCEIPLRAAGARTCQYHTS